MSVSSKIYKNFKSKDKIKDLLKYVMPNIKRGEIS